MGPTIRNCDHFSVEPCVAYIINDDRRVQEYRDVRREDVRYDVAITRGKGDRHGGRSMGAILPHAWRRRCHDHGRQEWDHEVFPAFSSSARDASGACPVQSERIPARPVVGFME
jgi:hypothetical protein